MKKTALFLYTVLLSATVFAQTGIIRGTIKTADGQPAEFINMGLKGTTLLTLTDNKGAYEIKNIQPGNYMLVAFYVGLESREIAVEVAANKTTELGEIILKENTHVLNEVVISAQQNKQHDRSEYVSKMPLKNMENPQVYSTVDARLMKEQVVTNFADALKNAPGVEKLWESTGRGGDGGGYYALRGFAVQPNLVNGLPGLTNGSLDPVNIEKIEVLKGPSGTLFGSSLVSYGGLINTVTKKPYEKFGGDITYITGSFGLNRIAVDVNAPLNKTNYVVIRMNTAYSSENSFQDAGFRNSWAVAPTLLYKVNDKLSFLVLTEFLNAKGTNPTMLFLDRDAKLTCTNIEEVGYSSKRSYTSNNLSILNVTYNLQAQVNYKLSDNWTSQSIVSRGSAKSQGYYSYLYEQSRYYPIEGMVFSRYISNQHAQTLTSDLQQNLIGRFSFGSHIKNKLVAGIDYYENYTIDNSTGYANNGLMYIGKANKQRVYDSVFGGKTYENFDSGILSVEGMNAALANSAVSDYRTSQQTYSAYFLNVVAFEPINLSAVVSLRYDYFSTKGDVSVTTDDYKQPALSPKFGLVYQPVKNKLALFANYMNGFSNVAPAQVGDKEGKNLHTKTFKPEQANQFEAGIKTHLKKDRLTASFSYYNIQVDKKVMPDPVNPFNSIQGGKVESKGFEMDIHALPFNGLSITAGYAYNESKVLNGAPEQLFSYVGRRPSEAGPQHLLNAWATYQFVKGILKGWGMGVGANGASKRLIMDSKLTGTFSLPAYTIYNASLFYNVRSFQLTLKVDNMTNEVYYKGWTTINPQRPISITASLSYAF